MPSVALAHTENSEGYSKIMQDSGSLRYELYLDYFELGRVVDLKAGPGAPQGEMEAGLSSAMEGLNRYLNPRLETSVDGVKCDSAVESTSVERMYERDYARISLRFDCPGTVTGVFKVHYAVFFDDSDSMHRNIASYNIAGNEGQFIFNTTSRELSVGAGHLFSTVKRFVQLGFHHILAGYDHVLFVVALLLGAYTLGGVLRVATVFTLAHSVTLALTALKWVSIPSAVVEPLIALSIAYVAVENLFDTKLNHRLAAVFGFGLLHGMGFAGALQLTGDVSWQMLLSLFSFNAGIELGQAFIILLLFPLLLFVRRFRWSSPAQFAAASVICVLGLVWFFERLAA